MHFTTPLALGAARGKRSAPELESGRSRRARDRGAAGRGGGAKGKGGGKSSRGDLKGLASRTPDNRLICFAYNNQGEKCDGTCNMVHVCRNKGCLGKHPVYECPTKGI